MKVMKGFAVAALLATTVAGSAQAAVVFTSAAGGVSIGIGDDGALDAGIPLTGIDLAGVGDALTPGCLCEAWGASFGATSGRVARALGGAAGAIVINPSSMGVGTFTTSATIGGGLDVTKVWKEAVSNANGALFEARVTLKNNSGGAMTDVRFERAMDRDVPPTPFNELVTVKGTATTTLLEHSTNDGFHNGDPLDGILNAGIAPGGTVNVDFTDLGANDHGAMFVFNFGGLADGEEKSFSIFYGAANSETAANTLLGLVGIELFSFGQSDGNGATGTPGTYVFGFKGVGGVVIVPVPVDPVPVPATALLFGAGLLGLAGLRRKAA